MGTSRVAPQKFGWQPRNRQPGASTLRHCQPQPRRALQEKHMKYGKVTQIAVTTVAVLGVLIASATALAAQVITPKHSNYRVVDLGTFGGPHSKFNFTNRVHNLNETAV